MVKVLGAIAACAILVVNCRLRSIFFEQTALADLLGVSA